VLFRSRTSYPYRSLPRRQFDLVVDMLAGRYADTRLRELRPRVSLDRIDNTIHGKEGVQRLIYLSGGTIPERGYYDLRVEESRAKIGELDEEFVWERSIGDTFTLGTQVWRIRKITPNDVEVVPSDAKPGIYPFWRAEDNNRDFHFSEKILLFLERFKDRLEDATLPEELGRDYYLDQGAAEELVKFLRRQREATRADLPHRHHLLIEHYEDPLNTSGSKQVILHTLWGGRVNRPFSLALQAAWEEKHRTHLEVIQNNDAIMLMLPHEFSGEDCLSLVTPENLEKLLRASLEKSGFFGARFRENAGRALLLPRSDFKKRLPLWLNRLRSKKLMDAVLAYPDFPVLLETWRTCLQDEFDLESLRLLLEELRTGRIRLTETTTSAASPFAEGLIWKQTNTYMYADDSPLSGRASRLSQDLLKEVLFSASLRPRIPENLIEALQAKLQRTAPGYAPRSADDLLDWTKERMLIAWPEWQALLSAMERDHGLPAEEALMPVKDKILSLRLPGASIRTVCALENIFRVARAFSTNPENLDARDVITGKPCRKKAFGVRQDLPENSDPQMQGDQGDRMAADILLQWLSFYGPVRRSTVREVLGLDEMALDDLLAGLVEDEALLYDLLTEQALEPEICDRENLEILLRMVRRSRQPVFKALSPGHLALFLGAWQGLAAPGEAVDDLKDRLDQLFGYPATAEAWEKQILPARVSPYFLSWLDSLLQMSGLAWFGCGKKRISLAFGDDLELFLSRDSRSADHGTQEHELSRLFPRKIGRYSLSDIVRSSNGDTRSVTKKLWDLVWQGRVSNDTFTALRQGILTRFAPMGLRPELRRSLRAGYNRWGEARPLPGNWYVLETDSMERDAVDEAELVKDRVRQLLKRYGIPSAAQLAP
jgi:ATP-dependent Lhr-like helicase